MLSSSQGQVHLNASISFNQTAYLPNSFVNVTISLQNNFTQALTDITFDSIFNTDLNFTSGSLHSNFSSLGVNETASASIEFKLPENAITASSLDVVFLIDGSGSMTDEITEVKTKVLDLISQLMEDVVEIRIAFIFFGSDNYHYNPYNAAGNILDFTSDGEEIQVFLSPWGAGGSNEPWGDALRYMDNLDWQGSVRLAILITDEPNNSGTYIKTDPQLYALAADLAEDGIIISTLECIGANSVTTNQLTEISTITGGVYVSLADSETSLIDEAIYMAREALKEYGIKIETNFTAYLDGDELRKSSYKWVLIDNKPPSLSPSSNAIFQPDDQTFLYRINCIVYDPSPVENVTLWYKFDTGAYQETLMNMSSPGLFTFLLPYLAEGTVVTYYLEASDALNNSISSNEYIFTVDFEITALELNKFQDIPLGYGEMMVLRINITDIGDYALIFHTTGNLSVRFISSNSPVHSQDLILAGNETFGMIKLQDFSGYAIIMLTNFETPELISFEVILCNILDFTMSSTKQITISNESPVYVYKVNIDITINSNFYCQIDATADKYQFFKMMVFTENTLIKFQYFHTISVSTETSGAHYVLILLKDTRPDSLSASVEITYGEIDDDPYFPGSPDAAMAINGFPQFAIVGFILISTIWFILQKRKEIKIKSI
jgi:Mg-chelatase subunit ChlD